jgi:hypothetical protein
VEAESLAALASVAAGAVVSSATADAWESVRHRLARLMARDDPHQTELADRQLQETREQLTGPEGPDLESARATQAERWAGQLADLLKQDPDIEADLRDLVEAIQVTLQPSRAVLAGDHSVAGGGCHMDEAGVVHMDMASSLAALAATDPGRALTIVQSVAGDYERGKAIAAIAQVLVASDPDRALTIVQAIASPYERGNAIAGIARVMATSDPDRALAVVQDITDNYERDRAIAGIAQVMAASNSSRGHATDRAEGLAPMRPSAPTGGSANRKAKIFISYSHKDDRYREQLATHLASLRRQGVIEDWHDRKIMPGEDWRSVIDQNLDAADCVLLLVTPDFLASDYCYGVEMQRALAKHGEGRILVIPVIVRPADWRHPPLGNLEALPKDAKPVVEWARRDRAWLSVAEGIRLALAARSPEGA